MKILSSWNHTHWRTAGHRPVSNLGSIHRLHRRFPLVIVASHDGCVASQSHRWKSPGMAQRLSLEKLARIEAMIQAAVTAGRHKSTIHRETQPLTPRLRPQRDTVRSSRSPGSPRIPALAATVTRAAQDGLVRRRPPQRTCAARATGTKCAGRRSGGAAMDHRPSRGRRRKAQGQSGTKLSPPGKFRPSARRLGSPATGKVSDHRREQCPGVGRRWWSARAGRCCWWLWPAGGTR